MAASTCSIDHLTTPDSPLEIGNGGRVEALSRELRKVHAGLLRLEKEFEPRLSSYTVHQKSARNLIHYLALRRHDIRQLQEELAALGLSSLGRTESHALAGIEAVLKLLHRLEQRAWQPPANERSRVAFAEGNKLLRGNTEALLGPAPKKRAVRIMVTMPGEAAENFTLVRDLLAAGMDCMRINCAHDNSVAWAGMIAHLQRAKKELGKECRVEMDLTGPKLRTGAINPRTQIVKWRPRRDLRGNVVQAATIWLAPLENPAALGGAFDACLRLPATTLAKMQKGDVIKFKDLRGKSRLLEVSEVQGSARRAELRKTVYLNAGSNLALAHISKGAKLSVEAWVAPPAAAFIVLQKGESLVLTRVPLPGHPAEYDEAGRLTRPATISCTLPEVFADLRPGEPIWFDDGKIGGVIETITPEQVLVRITVAKARGDRLGADKGINLPKSALRLPALTKKDLVDLPFVVQHADIVGLSFVRQAKDVAALQAELARLDAADLGIVLKIETETAFEHLPDILLEALRSERVGVMIARGDLAVECGWQRLAEVQEEILWVCEAAHVPVIWATQVLENLAKRGAPSRAEITDAAMGERAECVMLNKGPHLVEAVGVLDDILGRMEAHQSKKSARLRSLHLSRIANPH